MCDIQKAPETNNLEKYGPGGGKAWAFSPIPHHMVVGVRDGGYMQPYPTCRCQRPKVDPKIPTHPHCWLDNLLMRIAIPTPFNHSAWYEQPIGHRLNVSWASVERWLVRARVGWGQLGSLRVDSDQLGWFGFTVGR